MTYSSDDIIRNSPQWKGARIQRMKVKKSKIKEESELENAHEKEMLRTIKQVFLAKFGLPEDDPGVQDLLSSIKGLGNDAIKKMYREYTGVEEPVTEEKWEKVMIEIKDENLRRRGVATSGTSELLMERIEIINKAIDKIPKLRTLLLTSTNCPISDEQVTRLDECIRVLAKLTKIDSEKLVWDNDYDTCLVVGDTQMGKTSTFLLLCILTMEMSRLMDDPLDLAIIISSRNTEHRTQLINASEEITRWTGPSMFRVISDGYHDLKLREISHYVHSMNRCWNRKEIPVLIVKKNTSVLGALTSLLESPDLKGKKALLIQDECDEAAVIQREGGKSKAMAHGIHGAISKIRELIPGPYVGFTATEGAVMMMSTESKLFPKRILILSPGVKYRGAEYFILQTPKSMNRDAIGIQQPIIKSTARKWLNRKNRPYCIKQYVADYIVATTAKRTLHGENIVSKGLINASHLQEIHQLLERIIHLELRDIRIALTNLYTNGTWSDKEEIKVLFENAIESQKKRFAHFDIEESIDYYSEDFIESCIETARITSPYILNEKTEEPWNEDCSNVIVIAGQLAGRAQVYRGLTGFFIPLDPVVNKADTTFQAYGRITRYADEEIDLPFMFQVMLPSYRSKIQKMAQNKVMSRTQGNIFDLANVDMRVNFYDYMLPINCRLTGLSRSGKATSANLAELATTRPIHDRVKIRKYKSEVRMETKNSDDGLYQILQLLRRKNYGGTKIAPLNRGIVFYDCEHEVLSEIAKLCSDPHATTYLEMTRELHSEKKQILNICFTLSGKSNHPEDSYNERITELVKELDWPYDNAFYRRRSVLEEENTQYPLIDAEGCIKVKELRSSYLGYGENKDLGHDLNLDCGSENKLGTREEGESSLFTFGRYALTLGHASNKDSELIKGDKPILICGVIPDSLALAQHAWRNNEVEQNASNIRKGIGNDLSMTSERWTGYRLVEGGQ